MHGNGNTLFRDNRPLTAKECFEFLLDQPRHAYLVVFFGSYDFSQILRQLPIGRLKHLGVGMTYDPIDDTDPDAVEADHRNHPEKDKWTDITLEGAKYRLKYIKGHSLKIARAEPNPEKLGRLRTVANSQRTVHETRGFFQKSFAKATDEWLEDDPKVMDKATRKKIAYFKMRREHFNLMTPGIIDYCETECRLLAAMMDKLRATCLDGEVALEEKTGQALKLWPKDPQGAGTMAARLHKSAKTPQRRRYRIDYRTGEARPVNAKGVIYMPEHDPDFMSYAKWGYYGGRFEVSRAGLLGTVYNYDINSAYPANMVGLPCPLCTKWRELPKGTEPPPGVRYLAEVVFDHPDDAVWCGLPVRMKDGFLRWPRKGRGAYWSVEIEAAKKHLGVTVDYKRVWVADECCDHICYGWVEEVYEFRKGLGKQVKGHVIKLAVNSLYGKFAQQIGSAPYRDPISAGLITAATRAQLIEAIGTLPRTDHDKVVMLATDGVYSTVPLPGLDIGEKLGQWEHDPKKQVYKDMFIVQPGMYFFPTILNDIRAANEPNIAKDKAAGTVKSRGIHRSLVYDHQGDFEKSWREFLYWYEYPIFRNALLIVDGEAKGMAGERGPI